MIVEVSCPVCGHPAEMDTEQENTIICHDCDFIGMEPAV